MITEEVSDVEEVSDEEFQFEGDEAQSEDEEPVPRRKRRR